MNFLVLSQRQFLEEGRATQIALEGLRPRMYGLVVPQPRAGPEFGPALLAPEFFGPPRVDLVMRAQSFFREEESEADVALEGFDPGVNSFVVLKSVHPAVSCAAKVALEPRPVPVHVRVFVFLETLL